MRKFYGILMLVMLAAFSVSVVSCGDDDDEPATEKSSDKNGSSKESALIGSWKYEYGKQHGEYLVFTFKSDKEFRAQDNWFDEDNLTWYVDNDFGTWSLDGATVVLKWDDGTRDEGTFDGKSFYYDGDKFTKV